MINDKTQARLHSRAFIAAQNHFAREVLVMHQAKPFVDFSPILLYNGFSLTTNIL